MLLDFEKGVLSRIFKAVKRHWNFLYKVLTWGCEIILFLNIGSRCCNKSHVMKS